MGRRISSEIQKFKPVEAALRGPTIAFCDTIEKIEEALSKHRTEGEIALLKSIRDQVTSLLGFAVRASSRRVRSHGESVQLQLTANDQRL